MPSRDATVSRSVARGSLFSRCFAAGQDAEVAPVAGLAARFLVDPSFAERRFFAGHFVHGHLSQQRKNFFLDGAGNARFVLADVHVHFAAHSEFR